MARIHRLSVRTNIVQGEAEIMNTNIQICKMLCLSTQVFMEYAHCKDLRDMLDLVAIKLGRLQTDGEKHQSCAYEVRSFSKKLYFRPGCCEDNVTDQVRNIE